MRVEKDQMDDGTPCEKVTLDDGKTVIYRPVSNGDESPPPPPPPESEEAPKPKAKKGK